MHVKTVGTQTLGIPNVLLGVASFRSNGILGRVLGAAWIPKVRWGFWAQRGFLRFVGDSCMKGKGREGKGKEGKGKGTYRYPFPRSLLPFPCSLSPPLPTQKKHVVNSHNHYGLGGGA